MTPRLAACGLAVDLAGRRVVGPLDVAVGAGEVVAVVGPNGAGKTTLLRALSGLLPASAGRVLLDGEPVAARDRRSLAREIAYVPQHLPVEVPLSVQRHVLLARYAHHGPRRQPREGDRQAAAAALASLGLERLAERSVADLSGGERRLVGFAGALAQGATVWLLDEPTAHLDPAHQQLVARTLLELPDAGRRALLVATHDLELAGRVADRVVTLRSGVVVGEGTPREMLGRAGLRRLFGEHFEPWLASPVREGEG